MCLQDLAGEVTASLALKASRDEVQDALKKLRDVFEEREQENEAAVDQTMQSLTELEEARRNRSVATSGKYHEMACSLDRVHSQMLTLKNQCKAESESYKKSISELRRLASQKEKITESNMQQLRTAMGDLSATLRKDLQDKPTREELYTAIRREVQAASAGR